MGYSGPVYDGEPPRRGAAAARSMQVARAGASFGSALAIAISWSEHHSVLWAIGLAGVGLRGAGAVMGAVAGGVVGSVFAVLFAGLLDPGLSFGLVVGASIGAAIGAVLAPLASFTVLRTVPLWRVFVDSTAGT